MTAKQAKHGTFDRPMSLKVSPTVELSAGKF